MKCPKCNSHGSAIVEESHEGNSWCTCLVCGYTFETVTDEILTTIILTVIVCVCGMGVSLYLWWRW